MNDYMKLIKDMAVFFILVHIIILLSFPVVAGEWASVFAKTFALGVM